MNTGGALISEQLIKKITVVNMFDATNHVGQTLLHLLGLSSPKSGVELKWALVDLI